jgi:hypothetical protein
VTSCATAVVDITMTAETDIKKLTVVFILLPPVTGDLSVYHTPFGASARARATLKGHSILRAVGRKPRRFSFSRVWKGNPMPLGRYRINNPTIALFEQDGRHVADTVPAGAIIEINGDAFDGDKLLEVVWDGKPVLMFTQDLRKRAESVKGNSK